MFSGRVGRYAKLSTCTDSHTSKTMILLHFATVYKLLDLRRQTCAV